MMRDITQRSFVIPDIHGCCATFCALLEQIGLTRDDELYLLGDYIDRGPDSMEVISHIMRLQADGFAVRPIMGNHELMLLDAMEPATVVKKREWILNGGLATLHSYGVSRPDDIPEDHIAFIRSLPMFIKTRTHIFVHAALNLTLKTPFGRKGYDAMLWDRECSGDLGTLEGKTVVAGHTPRYLDEIRKSLNGHYVQIDNGCFWGNRFDGMGNLLAWELNSGELHIQPCMKQDRRMESQE